MAEELGHIDIRFPSTPGGGAGDVTGPLPTKMRMPNMGAQIATMMAGPIGAIASVVQSGISNMVSRLGNLSGDLREVVTRLSDTGKFSPEVVGETVALQMQELTNQMQEARVLGPLYATIIRWYRELMALIQPWKLLFSAISTFLVGVLMSTLKTLMQLLNRALDAILSALSSLLDSVVVITAFLTNPGAFSASLRAVGSTMMSDPLGRGLMMAVSSMVESLPESGISEMMGELTTVAIATKKAVDELREINKNTSPQPSAGLSWANTQLREILVRSHRGYISGGLMQPMTGGTMGRPKFGAPP